MKKKILIILLFLFIMLHTNVQYAGAIDKFPDTIYVKPSSLMGKYGWHLYKKNYSTSLNGNGIGKAFCTSFWNPAPGECTETRSACTKIKWCNDDSKNNKVAAAIGSIIYSARNSDGSMSWDNYFYTELAINRYIDKVGCGGSANKFSAPYQIENVIKKYVTAAEKVYKEYNSNTVIVSDLKINNASANGNNVIELTKANSYSLSATMICKDSAGNKVDCSTVKTAFEITTGGQKLTSPKVTYKKNNNKTITLTADVSKILKDNQGKEITFTITGYNKIKYYQAQRYSCGYSCSQTAQTMSPNALKPIENSKSDYEKGIFKAPTVVEETCGTKLANLKRDTNGRVIDEEGLVKIYQEEKDKGNDYGDLLNVDSPSCSAITTNNSISCGQTNIVKQYIDSKEINGQTYNMYCQLNYSFDSNILKDSTGNINNLIYKSEDGIVGQANVTYNCLVLNMPFFDKLDIKSTQIVNLKTLVPNISMDVLGKNIKFKPNVDTIEFKKINKSCSINNDRDIICDNYVNQSKNNEYGWLINFDVDYYYDDTNKWSVQKGNLMDTKKTYLINSDSCSKNCLEYGYGVYVPFDNEVGKKHSNFKVDVNGTKFGGEFEGGDEANSSCSYELTGEKIKSEVLYRGIDTSNPFLNYEGAQRYVGNNWCGSELDEPDSNYNDNLIIGEQTQCKKRYLGDVNNNNEWDADDIDLIQKAATDLIILNETDQKYADVNGDGQITVADATEVKLYIYQYNLTEMGDVNLDGMIDETDVSMVQLFLAGYSSLSEVQQKLANLYISKEELNIGCVLNINDASTIQKKVNGLNSSEEIDEETKVIVDSADKDINDSENNISRTEEGYYCSANNITVKKYITDRPNSSGLVKTTTEGVTTTSKVEPLYSFILTPSTLRKIREYNDSNSYNDFTLDCIEGKKCVSTFITKLVNEEYGNTFANGKCSNRSSFCEVTK